MQLTEKQKYEIIVRHELGQTINKITRDMKITKKTARKWIQKYKEDENVSRKKGSGRNRKTTLEQDNDIVNEIKNNNLLTAENIKDNLAEKQINISTRTVINRLNELGFSYKKPLTKPFLTEIHKDKRLKWALDNVNTDWNKIGFSDESSIWIGLRGRKRWTNLKEEDFERVVKYPVKLHIWGYITGIGIKRIHIFEGIMDAFKYIEILTISFLDIFFQNSDLIFQDDNDPKHRSEDVINWKNAYNIKSLEWPSNSPDLNPIENVWQILKNKVSKTKINTKDGLIKCIETKWNEIDDNIIKNLISSMPMRINEVIKNKGDYIDY